MGKRKEESLSDLIIRTNSMRDQIDELLEEYKTTTWVDLLASLEADILKMIRAHERLTKRIKNEFEALLALSPHHTKTDQPQWVLRKFTEN